LLNKDSNNNKKAKNKSINPIIASIGNTNDPIMNNTKPIAAKIMVIQNILCDGADNLISIPPFLIKIKSLLVLIREHIQNL
jgi:hypothetical protein